MSSISVYLQGGVLCLRFELLFAPFRSSRSPATHSLFPFFLILPNILLLAPLHRFIPLAPPPSLQWGISAPLTLRYFTTCLQPNTIITSTCSVGQQSLYVYAKTLQVHTLNRISYSTVRFSNWWITLLNGRVTIISALVLSNGFRNSASSVVKLQRSFNARIIHLHTYSPFLFFSLYTV